QAPPRASALGGSRRIRGPAGGGQAEAAASSSSREARSSILPDATETVAAYAYGAVEGERRCGPWRPGGQSAKQWFGELSRRMLGDVFRNSSNQRNVVDVRERDYTTQYEGEFCER